MQKQATIHGIAASPGEAVGRVKVVFNINELQKISQGDILVTPMTNPDMVLAMGKCSAIITDSGGLTSHAAIIARELKIPCVTGTGNATKLLRDNMLVKVDGTNGVVIILEEQPLPEKCAESEFVIFGNRVKVFKAKMVRSQPLCPKIDYQWIGPDMDKEYRWVIPRPEIHGSFIQRSLIAAGIERIPHALSFDDLSPLYVRYFDNVAIHFETIREILQRLRNKLIGCDVEFWKAFLNNLYSVYQKFETASIQFQQIIDLLPDEKLTNAFIEWWAVHNEFFSQTYLIQSMGDDIVWPYITDMIRHTFGEGINVSEYISILSAPITEDELLISTKFAFETAKLIESAPDYIEKIIRSNLDEKLSIELFQYREEGKSWIEMLRNHVKKWWWIRERDPYFDPISDEIEMLSFIRKFAPHTAPVINLEENRRKFESVLRMIRQKLNSQDFNKFKFLLECGRTLNRERDNHHHIWIRNTSIIRKFFLIVGKRFKRLQLIEHEKDIFFLTLPEIILLLNDPSAISKEELSRKVNTRIAHLKCVTRLKLHKEVEVSPPEFFDDIF